MIRDFSSGNKLYEKKEFKKQRERVKKLKDEIGTFYDMMKSATDEIVMPPFKNENNKKYFLK